MRSFMWIVSPSTRKTCVSGASTSSCSWPMPGMSVAKPRASGLTSSSSTTSESPGSAPRTAIGPVALLTRSRSISVTRSASVRIWPGEAVVRLERDRLARFDLEHGREIWAEGPDHLVPSDAVRRHGAIVSETPQRRPTHKRAPADMSAGFAAPLPGVVSSEAPLSGLRARRRVSAAVNVGQVDPHRRRERAAVLAHRVVDARREESRRVEEVARERQAEGDRGERARSATWRDRPRRCPVPPASLQAMTVVTEMPGRQSQMPAVGACGPNDAAVEIVSGPALAPVVNCACATNAAPSQNAAVRKTRAARRLSRSVAHRVRGVTRSGGARRG